LASAKAWLESFADEEERIVLQPELPASAGALDQRQRAYLHVLADLLADCPWDGVAVQAALFDAARCTPIETGEGFSAVYRVFLDRQAGPKAGYLLAFLDRDQVLGRLRALPYDADALWSATAHTSIADTVAWVVSVAGGEPAAVTVRAVASPAVELPAVELPAVELPAMASPEPAGRRVEVDVVDSRNRRHRARLWSPAPAETAGGRGPGPDDLATGLVEALREAGYPPL